MTETNTTGSDTVIIRTPDSPEIRWRTRRMLNLGADAELAATIARSSADVHDIERLLKAGCSLELAWTITEPVDEPPAIVPVAYSVSRQES